MDLLFEDSELPAFSWPVKVSVNTQIQTITLIVKREQNRWKCDATDIEAALSLWSYYFNNIKLTAKSRHQRKGLGYQSETNVDWLQKDAELDLRRRSICFLGAKPLGPLLTEEAQEVLNAHEMRVLHAMAKGQIHRDAGETPMGMGFRGVESEYQAAGMPIYTQSVHTILQSVNFKQKRTIPYPVTRFI
jgi:hypothetical protein